MVESVKSQKRMKEIASGYERGQKRQTKREQIMGVKGARMQERRLHKALSGKDAPFASQAPGVLKIKAKEAIKRVGEYKAAKKRK